MSRKKAGFEGLHPMVRVEWEDSTGIERWQAAGEVEKERPQMIETYGRLMRDDEVAVIVAGSRDYQEKPNVTQSMVIPRSAVRKVERLRVAGLHVRAG